MLDKQRKRLMTRTGLQNLGAAAGRLLGLHMALLLCAFLFFGCGGSFFLPEDNQINGFDNSGNQNGPAQENSAHPDLSAPTAKATFVDLIFSDSYNGTLVIYFDSESRIRLEGGVLVSLDGSSEGAVHEVNAILSEFPDAYLKRSVDTNPEMLERRRERLQKTSGKKMPNWNAVYKINIENRDRAAELYRSLKGVVKLVYPESKRGAPAAITDSTAPNIAWQQEYLGAYSASRGINVRNVWTRGILGEGATVIDPEHGFNFDHRDLPLIYGSHKTGGSVIDSEGFITPDNVDEILVAFGASGEISIAHGTSVVGILGAFHNGHGIDGIAPESRILVSSDYGVLNFLIEKGTYAGTVVLIEEAAFGPVFLSHADSIDDWLSPEGQFGQMPVESDYGAYQLIREATESGIIVVEGAANGSMNLDDPSNYFDDMICGSPVADPGACIDLDGDYDSGAIMVGAAYKSSSSPPRLTRAAWSNCGSNVNVFSWGRNVVSASYDAPSMDEWYGVSLLPNLNSDPNDYYTNTFGGTSAATAIIGGVVTLLEGRAKQLMGANRYVTPAKIRQILKETGNPIDDAAGCNVGVQPDVERAIERIDAIWAEASRIYPQLVSWKDPLPTEDAVPSYIRLTEAQEDELKEIGVGINCRTMNFERRDPVCPPINCHDADSPYYAQDYCIRRGDIPPDCSTVQWEPFCIRNDLIPHLEQVFDMDEDGRSELISWTNDSWKIDLSSDPADDPECNSEGHPVCRDNYGEWDFEIPTFNLDGDAAWILPVVQDWNSDGAADLALYDKDNAKLYIAFTNEQLFTGEKTDWDRIIDYSGEWFDQMTGDPFDRVNYRYSRPVPGNYNGDDYIDFAIACSDGFWRIDLGGPSNSDYGTFDYVKRFLTEEELAAAPGWAYLPVPGHFAGSALAPGFKIPDGLPNAGRIVSYPATLDPDYPQPEDYMSIRMTPGSPELFAGNDLYTIADYFISTSYTTMSVKGHDGVWTMYKSTGEIQTIGSRPHVNGFYGDNECYPVSGTYTVGDYGREMAAMCPGGEWRFVYLSDKFSADEDSDLVRRVYHEDPGPNAMPPMPVFGGVSYRSVEAQVRGLMGIFPGQPIPINADILGQY